MPGTNDGFAQVKWLPKKITFAVPFAETYYQYSDCPNEGTRDTVSDNDGGLRWLDYSGGYGYSITNYSRIDNTISIEYSYSPGQSNYCNATNKITFSLDSLNGKIHDFFMSYTGADYQNFYGCVSNSINISSLDFSVGDSILSASSNGGIFMKSIIGVAYSHSWWDFCKNDPGPHHGQWHKGYGFDHLLPDTTSYNCSITFVSPDLVNSVQSIIKNQSFSVSTSIPDHQINFTLPSSSHPQTLFIYDILGREAAREEIPSEITQYSLPSSRFGSGHYFARLGNLSAHFEVY